LAQAIVQKYHARWGASGVLPECAPDGPAVYQAAWRACTALGFIAGDASCLASAWQRRARRVGHVDELQWPDDPIDFGFGEQPSLPEPFAPCPTSLGLYVVAPSAAWVAKLSEMGVPTLQLRFKSDDPGAIRAEVKAAIAAVKHTSCRLFINDHWQIALEEGAWGVHLGQEDLDATDVTPLQAAGVRLGVSTHGYAEMLRADRVRPSYIAIGAIYPTTLKMMTTAPQGIARLGAYTALIKRLPQPYPMVAIGGIDRQRLPDVLQSGVGSVAVVRAVLAADDPASEIQAFKSAMTGSRAAWD
jgi:thiamine-phosphate pyrophosphorylase